MFSLLAGRCAPVPVVVNATADSTSAESGTVITYTCLEGHEFNTGISSVTAQCNAETWNYDTTVYCTRMLIHTRI